MPLHSLRQQLQQQGVRTLSNGELLSLALSVSPESEMHKHMQKLLTDAGGLARLLSLDIGQFFHEYGLTEIKAAQLQALLELARRLTLPSCMERYQIASPLDAANLLMLDMAHLDHEELRVLVLDGRNYVVANLLLYQGAVNTAVFRVAEILRLAVVRKCPGVLICHNHPSGDLEPSPEDTDLTMRCVEAGRLLDIQVVDHLIIGNGNHRFLSLKEKLLWTNA